MIEVTPRFTKKNKANPIKFFKVHFGANLKDENQFVYFSIITEKFTLYLYELLHNIL